jgi:hypothetical protein
MRTTSHPIPASAKLSTRNAPPQAERARLLKEREDSEDLLEVEAEKKRAEMEKKREEEEDAEDEKPAEVYPQTLTLIP